MNEEEYAQSVCVVQGCLQLVSRVYGKIPQVAVDGIYGESTRQAVYYFQKTAGLPANGIVDRETWEEIMRVYDRAEKEDRDADWFNIFRDKNAAIGPGAAGDIVSVIQIIQNSLRGRIRELAKVDVNGTYGTAEVNNTRVIQEIANLPQTGAVDKYTWNEYLRIFGVNI